ncbi:MAG: cupin domain-containing protein [Candidatus Omnitrophica bacterium]|nr:cupin domain-containing protein [Candidatus Omnitrophota bacterium]
MSDLKPLVVRLNDTTDKYQRLLAGAPDTAGMKAGFMRLGPGETVGQHSTESREEALIILEGIAEIHINGHALTRVGPGHLVYIPARTQHDVLNAGAGVLKYVYVVK